MFGLLAVRAPAGKTIFAPSIAVPLPVTVMVPPAGPMVWLATTVLVPETKDVPPLLVPLNVAVTDLSAFIVRVHVGTEPVHAPDHPPNVEPLFGDAVNETTAPLA